MVDVTTWNDTIMQEFRDNAGTTQMFGRDLVVLHTVGAKSGEARPTPLRAVRDGDAWLVTATAGGAPKDPAWAHNVRANPEFELEFAGADGGIDTTTVHAVETPEPERSELYPRFIAAQKSFAEYQEKTDRKFPVFRLTPREG
jgi:deazaflavin-dependent oxidoreductase (nitroreductase family)